MIHYIDEEQSQRGRSSSKGSRGGARTTTASGMSGSTMVVINPPRDLEPELRTVLPWLHTTLAPYGYHSITPLTISSHGHERKRAYDERKLMYESRARLHAMESLTNNATLSETDLLKQQRQKSSIKAGAGTGTGRIRTGGYGYDDQKKKAKK
jgi:hypothetical protein